MRGWAAAIGVDRAEGGEAGWGWILDWLGDWLGEENEVDWIGRYPEGDGTGVVAALGIRELV